MSQPTILAVDDSPLIHELIRRALEPDYRVLVADNAVDALTIIYHEPVLIVLLDVLMPQVDGLDFCRTLRNLPQFQALPVVMVTSQKSPFDRVQGRLAGANEYLTKPFDAELLRQTVQRFVGNSDDRVNSGISHPRVNGELSQGQVSSIRD
ncbi:MAG: response regulator [Scytolyngbya sp. HA4215-MV1]|nr:response regulator [Scytolyngbya sp. HA4215-MV1]